MFTKEVYVLFTKFNAVVLLKKLLCGLLENFVEAQFPRDFLVVLQFFFYSVKVFGYLTEFMHVRV